MGIISSIVDWMAPRPSEEDVSENLAELPESTLRGMLHSMQAVAIDGYINRLRVARIKEATKLRKMTDATARIICTENIEKLDRVLGEARERLVLIKVA